MSGIGTIVNAGTVIAGSLIGMVAKRGLSEGLQNALLKALGLATMFIGIGSTMQEMLVVQSDGSISTNGIMMMILSIAIGTLVGELLHIEDFLEGLGDRIKRIPLFRDNDSRFTEGFVTATLVVCVGAMAIVGALRDGLYGDPTMLYSKSVLDLISTMVFASTLGVGVLFSVIPMVLYQGFFTVAAGFIGSFFDETVISDLSLVGSVLIFAVGVNLFFGKQVKVGNMLPALLVPIFWGLISLIAA